MKSVSYPTNNSNRRGSNDRASVFVFDNSSMARKAVKQTLEELKYRVECFGDVSDCIEAVRHDSCDLLISDVEMSDMDWKEMLMKVKQVKPNLPVLFTTKTSDLSLGVEVLKSGAFSILKKPLERESFVASVESAIEESKEIDLLVGQSLSPSEEKILELIVSGEGNKKIAYLLHRSVRTVEWHRNRIMRKLNVDNVVDLVKTAIGVRR